MHQGKMATDTDSNDAFIANLRQFYESAKSQHKVSFYASIVAVAADLIPLLPLE